MHEMSFAEAIIRNVLRFAEEKQAKTVTSVRVRVGELLLINPEQLQFCFSVASKGTIAEGAKLEISVERADIRCLLCGRELSKDEMLCECGGFAQVKGGKDFILESVVVEV
ncbi:hydrogenase expression/formation protein (hypA) [Archaeoglobus fulgidus DSM 4304]|uniref:Hydrogenase maturation factor HypA n=3 Tax=Archaeoglobus fulgidus TaxID=2234 RepID=HYPA_ARCFU|nr:RecName: Full=Hydrogenase maturation factor HypA [Archaeoglobus fulgidus DSM 4304]AAB89875.1 hydrogenase expression/formation protein (hypA) [Archaeoglobus fulgidus DSM 4304]